MKKITILALHLGYGGVERAVATLANILSKKYEVEIISVYKLFDEPAFEIDNKVKIRYLLPNHKPNSVEFKEALKKLNIIKIITNSLKAMYILFNRRYRMIKAIKELNVDIIISTRVLFTKWLSKYERSNAIKIAQEHRHHNNDKNYINSVIRACKNIDYLMPVSEELTNFYKQLLNNTQTECIYIPHALEYTPKVSSKLNNKSIISIGRLSKEKGYVTLIDVFKLVNDKYPDWQLNIIGDGVEKDTIIELINHHNLNKNVVMHGYGDRKLIEREMLNASIYVMTSFEESFGLVLIEAQSYGLPCIAFDSAQGAREIIIDGENGYLISDRNIQKMANKIEELIDDSKLRKKMGQASKNNSLKYSKDRVSNMWYNFINNIVGGK